MAAPGIAQPGEAHERQRQACADAPSWYQIRSARSPGRARPTSSGSSSRPRADLSDDLLGERATRRHPGEQHQTEQAEREALHPELVVAPALHRRASSARNDTEGRSASPCRSTMSADDAVRGDAYRVGCEPSGRVDVDAEAPYSRSHARGGDAVDAVQLAPDAALQRVAFEAHRRAAPRRRSAADGPDGDEEQHGARRGDAGGDGGRQRSRTSRWCGAGRASRRSTTSVDRLLHAATTSTHSRTPTAATASDRERRQHEPGDDRQPTRRTTVSADAARLGRGRSRSGRRGGRDGDLATGLVTHVRCDGVAQLVQQRSERLVGVRHDDRRIEVQVGVPVVADLDARPGQAVTVQLE